jgi:hypothetical protein
MRGPITPPGAVRPPAAGIATHAAVRYRDPRRAKFTEVAIAA